MKLTLTRSIQLSAIAVIAGLTVVSCGDSDVVETAPEAVDSETVDSETVDSETVDSAVNKALLSEGKTSMGAIVRGQQAYFLEAGAFSSTLEELGLGLAPETERYTYTIVDAGDAQMIATATPKQDGFKSYSAGVFAADGTTVRGICEIEGSTPPDAPQLSGTEVSCPTGATLVK